MAGKKRNNQVPNLEKAKDFKGTLKKLLNYTKEYKKSFIVVIIFAILSTLFSIVGPKILGKAITELSNGIMSKLSGQSGINFNKITQILLFLLIIYIISAIFTYVQG